MNTVWSPGLRDGSIGELKKVLLIEGMRAIKFHGPVEFVPLFAIENFTAGRAPGGMMFAGTNESVDSVVRYPVAIIDTERSGRPYGARGVGAVFL